MILTHQVIQDIMGLVNADKQTKFIVTDDGIMDRANSLGYISHRLNDKITIVQTDACNLICSADGFEIVDAENIFSLTYLFSVDTGVIDTSKATDMTEMFRDSMFLSDLRISNMDTAQVTDMTEMFKGCACLNQLDLSRFNTEEVVNMRGMFNSCQHIKELDLSSFNTSKVENMASMFDFCLDLKSIDVSSFNTEKVKDMQKMFAGCENLMELDISNFIINEDTDIKGMFDNCISLRKLIVNNGIKDKIVLELRKAIIDELDGYSYFYIKDTVDNGNNKIAIELEIGTYDCN